MRDLIDIHEYEKAREESYKALHKYNEDADILVKAYFSKAKTETFMQGYSSATIDGKKAL